MRPALLSKAIDLCYSELDQPGGLSAMLSFLIDTYDLVAADIVTENRSGQEIETHASVGFDPAYLENYDEDYLGRNPWFTELSRLPSDSFHHVEQACPALTGTAYHNEWARPQGLENSLGVVLENSPTRQSWMGLAGRQHSGFTELRENLNLLLPHVKRVLNTKIRMNESAGFRCAANFLDNLAFAVMILDANGRRILANNKALSILDEARLLSEGANGVPLLHDPKADEQLRRAFAQACSDTSARKPEAIAPIIIHRGDMPAYALHVLPLNPSNGCQRGRMALAIMPFDAAPIDISTFSKAHGLTQSEAGVAQWLANGGTLAGYAENRDVSVSTARWHLKNAEAKTDTTRIEQLVSKVLLSQLPLEH